MVWSVCHDVPDGNPARGLFKGKMPYIGQYQSEFLLMVGSPFPFQVFSTRTIPILLGSSFSSGPKVSDNWS